MFKWQKIHFGLGPLHANAYLLTLTKMHTFLRLCIAHQISIKPSLHFHERKCSSWLHYLFSQDILCFWFDAKYTHLFASISSSQVVIPLNSNVYNFKILFILIYYETLVRWWWKIAVVLDTFFHRVFSFIILCYQVVCSVWNPHKSDGANDAVFPKSCIF